jgi:hypothetical protein
MKKTVLVIIGTGLFTTPVQAADWNDVRPGTFIGARLTIGGKAGSRPLAALTLAPTQNRISVDGRSSMRIGDGIAFNLSPGTKPTLTLAGVRADKALGLKQSSDGDTGNKLGLSDGGTIALVLGGAAVIAGGLYLAADHIADCDEGECD